MDVGAVGSTEDFLVLSFEDGVVVEGLPPWVLGDDRSERWVGLSTIQNLKRCSATISQNVSAWTTDHLVHDCSSTRTTTDDGNLGRVTAKGSNVALNPFQGEPHIKQASVRITILSNLTAAEEAESGQSVLNLDVDDTLTLFYEGVTTFC